MMPQKFEGQLVDFKVLDEGWTLIKLNDGNYLRIKAVIVKVLRTPQQNPDGSPLYFIQSVQAIATLTADEVQKLYKEEKKDGC